MYILHSDLSGWTLSKEIPSPDGQKHCSKCKQLKPITEFSRDAQKADGFASSCKTCIKQYARKTKRILTDTQRLEKNAKQHEYYIAHREHCIEYARNLRSQQKESGTRPWRKYALPKRYGITVADYDALLTTQYGVCAICGKQPALGDILCVDHDHATNAVRGLLCEHCNIAIGSFHENTDTIMSAIAYLAKHHDNL